MGGLKKCGVVYHVDHNSLVLFYFLQLYAELKGMFKSIKSFCNNLERQYYRQKTCKNRSLTKNDNKNLLSFFVKLLCFLHDRPVGTAYRIELRYRQLIFAILSGPDQNILLLALYECSDTCAVVVNFFITHIHTIKQISNSYILRGINQTSSYQEKSR